MVMIKSHLKKLQQLKLKIVNFRDIFFSLLETFLLRFFHFLPKFNFFDRKLLTFSSRGGRGIKKSNHDSEFFLSLPTELSEAHIKLHFNSKFWIVNSFKVIFLVKYTKKVNVVLVQYIRGFHNFPSFKLLEYLKKNEANIIKFWLDSWDEELWRNRILPLSNISKRNILIDRPNNSFSGLDKFGEYRWSPIPIISFPYINFKNRSNFVFYSGAASSSGLYRDRSDYISFIEDNNILTDGIAYDWKNPSKRPDYQNYRKSLANSKIALNFTWKKSVDVTTGRTWEIFSSGVLLLQNKSDILNGMFEPNIHFLEFYVQ
jgi:hypothetical protein